jgi:hypothetical protein
MVSPTHQVRLLMKKFSELDMPKRRSMLFEIRLAVRQPRGARRNINLREAFSATHQK